MISIGKNHIGRIFGGLNLTEFALFSAKKKIDMEVHCDAIIGNQLR